VLSIRLTPTDDQLIVLLGEDYTYLQDNFKGFEIFKKHRMALYAYEEHKNRLSYHIIYLQEWNQKNLVHEISHCIDNLFDRTGLSGSETRAYFSGWLFEIINEKRGEI